MKTKIIGLFTLFTLAISLVECQKPEKGEAGTPGKDGNANVTSMNLNVTFWNWDATSYWRYSSWTNVSILSQDVVDGGAVMLYQKMSNGDYIALPITANLTSTVQEHDFFFYGSGTLKIIIEKSDLTDLNPPGYTYKLVCIPKAARVINPDVNLLDYKATKQAFELED